MKRFGWLLLLCFPVLALALPNPVAHYRFDENNYNGSAGEVLDSSGNNLHGTTFNGVDSEPDNPAIGDISLGSCRYGQFDGNNQFVAIQDSNFLDFSNTYAISVWFRPDALPTSGLKTVLAKDDNYEIHIDTSGRISWRWLSAFFGIQRTINSGATINVGDWNHVVVILTQSGFLSVRGEIYLNGASTATQSFIGFSRQNNDALRIASHEDINGSNFDGDIDEVYIFNQVLSNSDIQELRTTTRPCAGEVSCSDSFPDGISSHAPNGTITFGNNAQLRGSPDNILNTTAIISGTNSSCDTGACSASLVPATAFNIGAFQTGLDRTPAVSPVDVTTGNNGNIAIGGVTDQYGTISVGNNSLIGTFTGRSDFYIDRLVTGNNTILNLVAGNYWIRNLTLGSNNTINVIGQGTVRLFVENNVGIPQGLLANAAAANSPRDASQFLLYSYGDLTLSNNSTISGVVYSGVRLNIGQNSFLYGAVSGSTVTIGNNTQINYLPATISAIDFGGLCNISSCTLGSFQILQPDHALACPFSRVPVQIQAICDDGSTIKDDYAGSINLSTNENSLSQFFSAASGGSAITNVALDGSEMGQTSVYLYHENENTALAVVAEDTVAGVTSTSTDVTEFRTSGFRVTDAANNDASPASFACGNSTSFRLLAIGEDSQGTPCQLLTGFTGNKDFKAWFETDTDPSMSGNQTDNTPLVVNSSTITAQGDSNAVPSANNLTLTFNSGVADISVGYANSAQIQALHFLHDDAPYGTAPLPDDIRTSTGSFVVSPDRIQLAISDSRSNCSSANATCSAFQAAGESFTMTATAQCSNGVTADQFIGRVNLAHELVAPVGGSVGVISTASVDINDSDNGQANFSQSVDEVGVFNFLTNPSSNPASYFGVSLAPFRLTNIGRFYPAAFRLTNTPMINSACNNNFSYMGQDALEVQFSVEALNTASVRVNNYTGSFAQDTNVTLVAENDNDGSNLGGRLANVDNLNQAGWINGLASYTDSDIAFNRVLSGPDGPYQNLQLGLQLSDDDAALTDLTMNAATTGSCSGNGCTAAILGSTDVRFGSLFLANAFGPETMPLSQRVEARYFDGNRFIVNTDDNACHTLQATTPPLTTTGALAALNRSVQQGINAGVGFIQYDAPGAGSGGVLTVEYQVPSWLTTEYGTNGDANDYEENPNATITFGQYRGNDRVIFWREVTN